jgi:ABC-type multidrug transport system fused ATPase/permease subunit
MNLRILLRYTGKKIKKEYIFTFILMIANSVLETITLSALMPLFYIILGGEVPDQIRIIIDKINNIIEGLIKIEINELLGIVILMTSTLAMFIRWLMVVKVNETTFQHSSELSQIVNNKLMNMDYLDHCNKNSSELIVNAINRVEVTIANLVIPSLNIASSFIIAMGLITSLMMVSPAVTSISLLGIFFIYFTLIMITKGKLGELGFLNNTLQQLQLKRLQENFGNIKNIIIKNEIQKKSNDFSKITEELNKTKSKIQNYAMLPRIVIEYIAILGLLLFALMAEKSSNDSKQLIAIMIGLGVMGQRLLPIFQQAYIGISLMQSGKSALKDLIKILEFKNIINESKSNKPAIEFKEKIVLSEIVYKYPNSDECILKNINITIKMGEKIAITGATGSGKSTLIDIILGLIEPNSGEVIIDEVLLSLNNLHLWRRNIAYVPQTIYLNDDSILRNIVSDTENYNEARLMDACKKAEIYEEINQMRDGLATRVGERGVALSGGQSQRIALAAAIYSGAKILVLDEPSSALNTEKEMKIFNNLKNKIDVTIMVITHSQEIFSNCDRILEMNNGVLIEKFSMTSEK